jgi:hypothetical protein
MKHIGHNELPCIEQTQLLQNAIYFVRLRLRPNLWHTLATFSSNFEFDRWDSSEFRGLVKSDRFAGFVQFILFNGITGITRTGPSYALRTQK